MWTKHIYVLAIRITPPRSMGGAHLIWLHCTPTRPSLYLYQASFGAPKVHPYRHRTSAYFGGAVQVQRKSILSAALLMCSPPTWAIYKNYDYLLVGLEHQGRYP